MNKVFYEPHSHQDPFFTIIFHYNQVDKKYVPFESVHWHESIEIIYFMEGEGIIQSGIEKLEAKPGDIIIINSNDLHQFQAETESIGYYCLIIENPNGREFESTQTIFNKRITDQEIKRLYARVIEEMTHKESCYKEYVKALGEQMMIELYRKHRIQAENLTDLTIPNHKMEIAKKAITYIHNHYQEPIAIDDICSSIGFSKYYFCRVFKEAIGKTVIDYINQIKCEQARKLLLLGQGNVTQVAELMGFNNLPYFSRIYKKYMGCAPSEEGER